MRDSFRSVQTRIFFQPPKHRSSMQDSSLKVGSWLTCVIVRLTDLAALVVNSTQNDHLQRQYQEVAKSSERVLINETYR